MNLVWNVWLFTRSGAYSDKGPLSEIGEDHFTWVFSVPALDEEVTIAEVDSQRLAAVLGAEAALGAVWPPRTRTDVS